MTEMPSNYDDFASFLHRDKQDPKWALDEEKAIILLHTRAERFVSGLDSKEEAFKYIKGFFGSKKEIERTGLHSIFEKIKKDVIQNKNIGYILLGYYHMRDNTENGKFISKYTTNRGNTINLTVDSVCKAMMDDEKYFKDDSLKIDLCKKVQGFDTYINSI